MRRTRATTVVGAVVGAITVIAIAAIATAVLVSTAPGGSSAASPGGGGPRTTDTTTSRADAPDPTTTSPSIPVPTDESSARQLLENQVANDRSQAESLAGYWVPQLSSKRPGLVANGVTYDYRAIWSDFTNLRLRYPGALLLWSGDYSSFRYTDFWVTVAPQAYGNGESANGWCDSAGIGKNDCYAKRIMHTGSYADSTLLRR